VSAIGQRKELETALGFVRDGDTFVVTKLDQLARSTQHALNIVEGLENRGVGLRILDFAGESIATKSPQGKLVLTMFAAFAEFERRLMWERQRAGIAKAKSEGKYKGRKPTARAKTAQVRALAPATTGSGTLRSVLGVQLCERAVRGSCLSPS
jgi:DNA invertase Pin-like site-specific DNA recombinase